MRNCYYDVHKYAQMKSGPDRVESSVLQWKTLDLSVIHILTPVVTGVYIRLSSQKILTTDRLYGVSNMQIALAKI